MPAKQEKKEETISGFNNSSKLTIQKSRPLFALWQSDLTLAEFKILDTYLGRINSHDDVHRTVTFEKGELEKILGVTQLKPQDLDSRLQHLMTTVCIPDENNKKGFTRISLFDKAHVEQDDYGVWSAELTCGESAKKYIFNVENLGYLRYKLKNIIHIKSRYAYIMFLYIWDNKNRVTWDISLEELKHKLNCENVDTYKQFYRFNDLILKKIHNEIHKVTDIRYSYEPIKKGRTVIGIRFTYISKYELENTEDVSAEQLSLVDDFVDDISPETGFSSACNNEFSNEQMDVLVALVREKIPSDYPKEPDVAIYEHLNAMYKKMAVAEQLLSEEGKRISNRYGYFEAMIRNDKSSFSAAKNQTTPRMMEHGYNSQDYKNLEKQLLVHES